MVGGKFATLNLMDCDVDNLANVKEVPLSTAQSIGGIRNVLDLCDKRRAMKKETKSKQKHLSKYKEIKCAIRKGKKAAREHRIMGQWQTLEQGML